MAKSYYILKAIQIAGTTESDAKYEMVPECTKVTEQVAKLFYDYLADEMGTMPFFDVKNEIENLRNANSRTVKTVFGILVGKVGGYDRLGGFVASALKKLNDDIKADTENGTGGLSNEEYAAFYGSSKRPRHSHWIYYRAKLYATEKGLTTLPPYKKPTTIQSNDTPVPVGSGVHVEAEDLGLDPNAVRNNGNGTGNGTGNGDPVVVNPNGTGNGDGDPTVVVNPNGTGNGTGNGDGDPTVVVNPNNGNGTGNGDPTVVVTPSERGQVQRQDTTPAENQNSAKYNPTAGFMRRHVSIITTLTILTTIFALAFTPGTFWATSLLSLLAINFATWAVSFSIMTFVPGLREAKRRDALRAKIDKCSTLSNKHISDYNNNMNVALSQAGVTLCDLQIAAFGEGADKERAMAKVRAALGSCNRDKVLRAIENSKRELQTAINQLYSTNGRGVIVGALRHQEELYDAINARRNSYESRGNTSKVRKYDNMPVALRNYIATYIRCEQAVIEINQKIDLLIQCGLEVEKPHFENWDTIKEKTRRYYAGVLNAYYEENHYERDGQPLRINSAGERIKPVETLEEILDDVSDLTGGGTHVVAPHSSDVVVEVVDDTLVSGSGNNGSGNEGM